MKRKKALKLEGIKSHQECHECGQSIKVVYKDPKQQKNPTFILQKHVKKNGTKSCPGSGREVTGR